MVEGSAYLVDRTLPHIPYRQWTLTLPSDLARRVAFDRSLCSAVFRIFVDCVQRWYETQAIRAGVRSPQGGALLQIQRFADGAALWPHGHAAFGDGVYTENGSEEPRFVPSSPPTIPDVQAIVSRIAHRTRGLLRRRGLLQDESNAPAPDDAECGSGSTASPLIEGHQLLLQCAQQAPNATERLGGAVHPNRRVRQLDAHKGRAQKGGFTKEPKLLADAGGFGLHADRPIEAHRRDALEHLLRYMARPPVPTERVRLREDGKVTFYLKRARRNGVNALVFEPQRLVARLAALVPPPGMNLRRYHGFLAAAHPLRRRIAPRPPDPKKTGVPTAPKRPKRLGWHDLLKRVFALDALQCPLCRGPMRFIRTVEVPTPDDLLYAAIVLSGRPDEIIAALVADFKQARSPPDAQ